jgi:hypothetical protein
MLEIKNDGCDFSLLLCFFVMDSPEGLQEQAGETGADFL